MTWMPLPGRVLFLCEDPEKVRLQLAGEALDATAAGPLRHDISTDEITPNPALTFNDARLGRHVYTGFRAGGVNPIGLGAIQGGGFSVVVAGRRYGKGSSREHSPAAELHAGVRLVVAESFERIYRQNADNLGLFTSTDFGLIPRIQRGEAIAVEELAAPREKLAGAILRAGGLLKYGALHMQGLPAVAVRAAQPLTLADKILARNLLRNADSAAALVPGEGAFVRAHWRFIIEVYTGMAVNTIRAAFGEVPKLVDPASILCFAEHFSYIHESPAHIKGNLVPGIRVLHQDHEQFAREHGIRSHGYQPGMEGSEGICHPMMAELYALPGQVVVGTDSHTPHSGALGCLAFGVGTTDMANAMLTGAVRLTLPESIRIELRGVVPAGVTGKDIVLHLLAHPKIRSGAGVGKVFEFTGPALAALPLDERATLTNMAAELGGLTGIVAPDAETVRFLKERRGVDFQVEPWMASDEGATYADTIGIDCAQLSPMVAAPGDPGNAVPLATLAERARIDIAFAGSCTGGKRADFDAYHAVLSWAAERGLKVPAHVKLYLQYGTVAVRDYCLERGYGAAFAAVGATVLQPACGACANLGPGASTDPDQVTVSAQNRNFPGRSGPGQIWLASPPTVVASAIAGELVSFDELRSRVAAKGR
ncbi:MAG: 3-isopropylmalate dehydratase [Burkholderiales bacterium]|nr:3-isopropylmalate dehydratase [Burkholderiales bacterium]